MLLFLGVFSLSVLYVFLLINCIFEYSLCSHAASVIGLVPVVPTRK